MPRKLARLLIGLLLLIAPWLFGTTENWSWAILQGLALLAVLLAAAQSCCSRGALSPRPLDGVACPHAGGAAWLQRTWNWWWGAPLLAVTAYLAAQAVNPSHLFMNGELIPIPHIAALPSTVDAPTSCLTLLKWLTYAGLFWAVRAAFTERRHVWALLSALAVSGLLLALVGLAQNLAGTDLLLGLRKGGFFMFGPFVNRNNYASYVNLLIPVALAVAHHCRHVAHSRQERSHPGGLFVFMALMMVLSVLMTTSRAGIVICAGLLLAWGALEMFHAMRGGGQARRMVLMAALGAIVLMAGLLYLGAEPLEKRLAEMREVPVELATGGGRGAAYQATWKMFRDHWFYGIGAGTFSMAYPYYSIERMDWFRRYAHNDWLQYLAELGVLGAALLAAFGVGVLREQWKARPAGGVFDRLAVALVLGLAGVALHALVDFPVHIPSIAVLVVAFAGLLTIPGVRKRHETC